mgnify:CR=1 FL=1|tara:strand:+ start:907 stop:1164 length:258 start_codon:yes stop_codon:yes gene_type:complete
MLNSEHFIEFATALVGSAVFGLIGFVWKISHRVTNLENRMDGLVDTQRRDRENLQKDVDTILANVDKNREWTTNRMMSIVRDSKD